MTYFEVYTERLNMRVPNKGQGGMLVKKKLLNNTYSSNKIIYKKYISFYEIFAFLLILFINIIPNDNKDIFFFEERHNKNFFLRLLVSYDKTYDDLNNCKHLIDSKKKIMLMENKSKHTNQEDCSDCENACNESVGNICNINEKNNLKDQKNNNKIKKQSYNVNNVKLDRQNTKKIVDIKKVVVNPNVEKVHAKSCENFLNEKKKYFSEKMNILNSINKYTWNDLYKGDKTKHIHILWKQNMWREWNYYISMIKIKDDIQDMYYFNEKIKSGYPYDKVKSKLKKKLNSKKFIILKDWEKFLEIHLKEWETYKKMDT
ncbi:uncharacterized protein PFC0810c-like [Piliocolobus tephrosceles]|uniref:uncharacterized protein PFC0810c-like n=1 Tax=Piliocolobus tephrosceles TaxID=591936 RepID=UPI000E6B48CD|nr:uncharacterized protein PFC0810c-like [Piliocolobus tephrosceles]